MSPMHLVVARSVLEPDVVKFFMADAPQDTPSTVLLHVAFSRWRVERCFEDEKTELGFDHFEGRSYVGLMRHQTITALTHLFLSRVHQQWRGEKTGADCLSDSHSSLGFGPIMVADEQGGQSTPGTHSQNYLRHARPQGSLTRQPPQTNSAEITKPRNHRQHTSPMRMAENIAL
jgi:hypothetical protein